MRTSIRCFKMPFTIIPFFIYRRLEWKDKWHTPRIEITPNISFRWLWFELYIRFGCEQYWEQKIWIEKYHNGNKEKAKKEWGWYNSETKQSTWKDRF